jgi:hypothetical protein
VISVAQRNEPETGTAASPERMRESVRWLARTVDSRSRLAVGRWYAIAMAERQARRLATPSSEADGR